MRGIGADLVWTGDRFREGMVVLIEGDSIAEVVDEGSVPAGAVIERWDGVALMPGTVNAHGHAFQSLFKGLADDRTFESWRDEVLYPFSERLDADAIYTGSLFAFAEALLSGTTTTVDFFYLHDESNENAELVIRAARDIGIRLVMARAFYDPETPTAAPTRYRESAADAADRCRALAEAHRDDPWVTVQPAPHSLHAASPETIGIALELARESGVPCHLHLAEARYEVEQVRERYGTTPVRLLERGGLLDPLMVLIHSVWIDDAELDLIAESGATIVHCPGANAFLGDGIAPVSEMLSRGIRVALGPDGGCANNRQSVFDEMRMATLVAKARLTDGSALDAYAALRMGTRAGADALRLPVGAIEPGRRADFVALDLEDLSLQPRAHLERHLVSSMQSTAVSRVVVGGETVVEDGRPTMIDSGELRAALQRIAGGWERP